MRPLLLIFVSMILLAATAAAQCVTPVEDYNAGGSIKLCNPDGNAIYYLNDTSANGSIVAYSINDTIIDCDGATLRGNFSSGSIGISVTSLVRNVTVMNCILDGFSRGIRTYGDNVLLQNNTFINSSNQNVFVDYRAENTTIRQNTFIRASNNNIYFQNSTTANITENLFNNTYVATFKHGIYLIAVRGNWNIYNNSFINKEGVDIESSWNISIYNNTWRNIDNTLHSNVYVNTNSGNINITDNNFLNGMNRIIISSNQNVLVSHNYFYNDTEYMSIQTVNANQSYSTDNYLLIFNNTIDTADVGIQITNSKHVHISNNTLKNIHTLFDDWAVGIMIEEESDNISVNYNNISYASVGILLRNSSNINITNCSFEQESIAYKLVNTIYDKYEPTCAIGALTKYKGFFDGDVGPSTSIFIAGNKFNENVQSYVRLQGTNSFAHDLTEYWYVKFNVSGYSNQTGIDEFFNNHAFSQLTTVKQTPLIENGLFFKSGIETSGASGHSIVRYNISKQVLGFGNVNTSQYLLEVWNLTLPFNDILNSTSGQILATNQSEYNVTLSPGDEIYVADYTNAVNITLAAPASEWDSLTVPFSFSAASNNNVSIADYYISDGTANYSYPTTNQYTVPLDGAHIFTLYAIDDIGAIAAYTLTVTVNHEAEARMDALVVFAQGLKLFILGIVITSLIVLVYAASTGKPVNLGQVFTVSGVIAAVAFLLFVSVLFLIELQQLDGLSQDTRVSVLDLATSLSELFDWTDLAVSLGTFAIMAIAGIVIYHQYQKTQTRR